MATNFYKYENSYYEEGSHNKILDLKQLGEYSKAGGKEIQYAPDASWQRIANPDEIKNYNVKGQFGTTLYGTAKTPKVGTEPIPSSELESTIDAPEPISFLSTNDSSSLSDKVSEVAKTVFDSNQLALDNLRAEQQALIQKQKDLAAAYKDKAAAGLEKEMNTTESRDALRSARELFKVEENIKLLNKVNQQIVSAKEALNMGLIYEENRPARMQLLTGRMATLQKQGLASIGALQGTAAVLQGNIDLADAYARSTITAIKEDSARHVKALNTLLEMADSDLVLLNVEEKRIVNERLGALNGEMNSGIEDHEAVIDMMKSYPKAFLDAGVTLLDTKESALKKMLPYMAADERRLFENKFKTGGSGSGTTAAKEAEARVFKSQLLALKDAGATYDEAVTAFGDVLDISYIRDIYGKTKPSDSRPGETVTDNYYEQFLDENGEIKSGYTVEIDPKNGRPIVKEAEEEKNSWWKFWNWF